MDLSKFLNILRRYSWLIVLATLVASLTTFFVVKKQPVLFEARARLLVGPNLDNPIPDLNSLRIGGQLILTYDELENTRSFLESVNNKLDQKTDIESLGAMIETKLDADTRILTIIVQHPDPKQAVAIANAAAETLIERSPAKDNTAALLRTQMSKQSRQLEQIISNADASIQGLETELIALGSSGQQSPEKAKASLDRQNIVVKQLAEERTRLSDALKTLATVYQVLLNTDTNHLEVIDPAGAVLPISGNLPLKVAASGIAGLILALSLILASEYFDDTIRFPVDFTNATKVPMLATIDRHNRLGGSGLERVVTFIQPKSRAANSYRMAVAKLLFSIGQSKPYTFLLSSVGLQSGDESAIAAANLAVAFAQAGKRVVLLDAQFHNPILTKLLMADGRAGLSDLLVTNSTKLQLLLKEVPGVRLLSAGLSSEKGAGMVLNSEKIVRLLEEIQKDTDVVLVVGSPISWFAEGLTLASQVNSVILVARHGEAHGKIVNDVVENLRVMNIQLAGGIFDQNSSPFVSKQNLRNVSAVPRAASKAATAIFRNLKIKGQVNVDTIRPPDPADVVMPAAENTELNSLDQVDLITIPTPDTDNLPMPADEIEVSSLAIVTIDVDAAQSPNLTDSITSTDEMTSLEKVVIDPTQPRDLVEDVAIPADENIELPNLRQVDVDTIQSPDLADAATFVNENLELPNLDQVDVFSAPSPALAPHHSTMFSEENLELALLATGVEKVKINDLKNSKDSHRVNRRKRNRP